MATRAVKVGSIQVGGGARVSVQSMTNTKTEDAAATASQLRALEAAGCEIARVSVYNEACAAAIPALKAATSMPLVADIHFDYRLAIAAIEHGIDKLRINPGNIGGEDRVAALVAAAKNARIPIRVGVNGGSLGAEVLRKHGGPTADALCEAALGHVRLLEKHGFYDTVVSIKSSSVPVTIAAYEKMARLADYPLHIGVTEAGAGEDAIIKSAVGLGALLWQGIGDTLRVSITGDPVQEVAAGQQILRALGLRKGGIELVSCPTCGRCAVDLEKYVREIAARLPVTDRPLRVAVMGCAVNGPGEAKEADLGIAFGPSGGLLFENGEKLRKVEHDEAIEAILALIVEKINGER